MDLEYLRKQMKLSEDAIKEMNRLNSNYEGLLSGLIKSAPEEHKKSIEGVKTVTDEAVRLAKEGKTEEAKQLLKNFTDGQGIK